MNRKLLPEFMNTHEEVHAVTHGIYAGMTEWKGMPDNQDVIKEPRYYKCGYIAGTMLRWSAILLIGSVMI